MSSVSKYLLFLTILTIPASAQIDSGGGQSSGGSLANHSSIGSPIATLVTQAITTNNHPGLIEVLYPITPSSTTDVDGNGLPDGWEMQNFGHIGVNPYSDPTNKGNNILMDYLAGTNPNNASSVFRPQGTYSKGIFQMPIQTIPDRDYNIWVSRDLQEWILQSTLTGDGTQQNYQFDEAAINSGPLHSARHPSSYFFRVEILIP